MNNAEYEYGKWVETNVIPILRTMKGFGELTQMEDKYSRVDGVILNEYKLTPVQIKAISPRIFYKDFSMKKSQFDVYQEIARINGEYIGVLISSIHNPQYDLSYYVYRFNFSNIKYMVGTLSQWDSTPTVYIKLNEMERLDILPEDFQREMELRHIKYMRPKVSTSYIDLYRNKF